MKLSILITLFSFSLLAQESVYGPPDGSGQSVEPLSNSEIRSQFAPLSLVAGSVVTSGEVELTEDSLRFYTVDSNLDEQNKSSVRPCVINIEEFRNEFQEVVSFEYNNTVYRGVVSLRDIEVFDSGRFQALGAGRNETGFFFGEKVKTKFRDEFCRNLRLAHNVPRTACNPRSYAGFNLRGIGYRDADSGLDVSVGVGSYRNIGREGATTGYRGNRPPNSPSQNSEAAAVTLRLAL